MSSAIQEAEYRVAAKQFNEGTIYGRLQKPMTSKGNMGKTKWLDCPHCRGSMIPLDAPAFESIVPLPKPSILKKSADPVLAKTTAKRSALREREAHAARPRNSNSEEDQHISVHRERQKQSRAEEETRIFADVERARREKEQLVAKQNQAWREENDARERELKANQERARLERERRAEAERRSREQQRAAMADDLRQRMEALWVREDAVRVREEAMRSREEAMRVRRSGLAYRMDAERRAIAECGGTSGYDIVGNSSASTKSVLTLLAYRETLRGLLDEARSLARLIQSSGTWGVGGDDVLPASIVADLERLPECI